MNASAKISEQMRRVAARSTREIMRRRGTDLGMYMGCGFPKSGTVWLCQLLGTALGVPYPREYRSPIAMASVIHTHWRYDAKYPATAYIRRDGRDVMLSLYFYYVRALDHPGKPSRARNLREMFEHMYGPGFDATAVRENLPKFIETQMRSPRGSEGLAWHQHVSDWWQRPGVAHVSYEELLADPVPAVMRLTNELTGSADDNIARLAAERWSFATAAQRKPGQEDRSSFMRKGVAGDWSNYFSREAGEVFDSFAGAELVEFGYASDRDWYLNL
ncbi:sulfotransferase domain-containing protein [Arthrobacter castelli]|uniref:sulfotransferase domain-containing protein n=1 Tax=Arthrobacter castelli TaxID=271431 RepID=UPI0009D6BD10|nr:sulfotransferase domain-containing protein [Arthrobacter castelli]